MPLWFFGAEGISAVYHSASLCSRVMRLVVFRAVAFQTMLPLAHFLPFFFFFPPPEVPVFAPAFGSVGSPPILTSPLSSSLGVDRPSPPVGALRSSTVSGSAAMCLPSRPRFPISLPTSAPLFVSYCRHVPDSGSYVLSVKVTVTSSGSCDGGGGDDARVLSAGLEACFAAYFWRFFIFEDVGFRTVYLEIMRV